MIEKKLQLGKQQQKIWKILNKKIPKFNQFPEKKNKNRAIFCFKVGSRSGSATQDKLKKDKFPVSRSRTMQQVTREAIRGAKPEQ